MKDQHDKRTGNLLATPNAIRQARFAEQQRAMGRKARKIWATDEEAEALRLPAGKLAVGGAAVIRFDQITPHFLMGFLLLQKANFTYAAGQVMYKHLVARYPSDQPHFRRFGYFYLGALLVVLPAFLLFGKADFLPQAVSFLAVSHQQPV